MGFFVCFFVCLFCLFLGFFQIEEIATHIQKNIILKQQPHINTVIQSTCMIQSVYCESSTSCRFKRLVPHNSYIANHITKGLSVHPSI